MQTVKHAHGLPSQVPQLTESDTALIRARLREWTGISVATEKRDLLQRRLNSRFRALGVSGVREYLRRLDSVPDERQAFINVMTTNETRCFRTARLWRYLETQFLPDWCAAHPNGRLRAWSAASSTGEEVYSLAMLFAEWRRTHPTFDFQLLATDIDSDVLAKAKTGLLSPRSEQNLRTAHAEWAERYGDTTPNGYQVQSALRQKIEFGLHNLHQSRAMASPMDLILVRNVLIYFELADQVTVIGHLWRNLARDGKLILGESESLAQIEEALRQRGRPFGYVEPQIYRKIEATAGDGL